MKLLVIGSSGSEHVPVSARQERHRQEYAATTALTGCDIPLKPDAARQILT